MIRIQKYTEDDSTIWNSFNRNSKNPLFMFDRHYMDYHKDRFTDHSLMFYENEELIALLPLNEKDNSLISHGGLTYGGFITGNKMKQHIMNDCFTCLIDYAGNIGFSSIFYKLIPFFYHLQPAEEDRYSLFINHAELVKTEASTVVNLKSPLKMSENRKRQIKKAAKEGVRITELTGRENFYTYIGLVNSVLSEHHNTVAVHTGEEIFSLYSDFPNNIHLYGAIKENELIAGTIVFEYAQTVHTQYLAANDTARAIGALDLCIQAVIDRYKKEKNWLDFGISTEEGGLLLNHGLISQKEGFGGRTVVNQMWKIDI